MFARLLSLIALVGAQRPASPYPDCCHVIAGTPCNLVLKGGYQVECCLAPPYPRVCGVQDGRNHQVFDECINPDKCLDEIGEKKCLILTFAGVTIVVPEDCENQKLPQPNVRETNSSIHANTPKGAGFFQDMVYTCTARGGLVCSALAIACIVGGWRMSSYTLPDLADKDEVNPLLEAGRRTVETD